MTVAVFAVPGDLASLTGGYAYDREILARVGRHGVEMTHLALPNGFPAPSPGDVSETRRLLATVSRETVLFVDGLAYGAFTPEILESIAGPVVAMVHHPLALETGLDAARREALLRSERVALARASHVIVPSAATMASLVTDYGVAAEALTVATPGVHSAPRARGSNGAFNLLAVGSVVPRKGYDVLVEALAKLRDAPWSLTIAGSLARAPDHVALLRQSIERQDLAARIALAGEVDAPELERLYDQADVFVLASHFEGYGMVLAEAMTHGLPIVVTRGGAAGDTVPDEAALKIPPGDPDALSAAIGELMRDPTRRKQLADASFQAGRALPTWDETAAIVASVLRRVHQGRHE
jgi:glycosyltransferase involved in cell wall biosynthesis